MGWLSDFIKSPGGSIGDLGRNIDREFREAPDIARYGNLILAPIAGYQDSRQSSQRQRDFENQQAEDSASDRRRTDRLRQQMQTEAGNFRSDLTRLKSEQSGLLKDSAESALNRGLRDIRIGAKRRGLLYSGYRQGAESDLRSRVASSLASQSKSANSELEDVASKKEAAAASVGLESYRDALQRADVAYNLVAENAVRRQQALEQLGEGVGYGFGASSVSNSKNSPGGSTSSPSSVKVGDTWYMDPYRQGLLRTPVYGMSYYGS